MSRTCQRFPHVALLFLLGQLVLLFSASADNDVPSHALNEDSVVLITGAAGFIGSELAMALHRTYQPKQLILIDALENGFSRKNNNDGVTRGHRDEQNMALLEFKRKRIFHILQTVGSKAHFYRVDFRPSIPEFFDTASVDVLPHIFDKHPDITHVVHLADHYHVNNKQEQAVPRAFNEPKAGMMDALLEQIARSTKRPQFLYASSHQVYNYLQPTSINPAPFSEDKPITAPSSLRGAAKLLDELMAQRYHQKHQIASIGLRFFDVYGPWGVPDSRTYELAELAVSGGELVGSADVRDYIYIDDAVDIVMSAMQVDAHMVLNVGTGVATSQNQLAQTMQAIMHGANVTTTLEITTGEESAATVSYASMERVRYYLGLEPRVSLAQGLEYLLAWHMDKAYPYGGNQALSKSIEHCSRYDEECLRGLPIYPCASECARVSQCIPTFWDDIVTYTRNLTASCQVVKYTVALDNHLSSIPSSYVESSAQSHLPDHNCNIAFVNEGSPLVQRAITERRRGTRALKDGFWTLVPVGTSNSSAEYHLGGWMLLPKLSPGLLFGESTKTVIYCDPNIIVDSISTLLDEANTHPYHVSVPGATALLIGKSVKEVTSSSNKNKVQENSYRMMRIAMFDEMTSNGFSQHVDPSFLVHALQNDDARDFRCDVYGEVLQWDVENDASSFEFIMGLHDMWSHILMRKIGLDPWWEGGNVTTVRSKNFLDRRRLQQELGNDSGDDNVEQHVLQEDIAHNGFGRQDEVDQQEEGLRKDPAEKKRDEPVDDPMDFEDEEEKDQEVGSKRGEQTTEKDLSLYDTWVGILSSTETRFFVRIVPANAVGVTSIQEQHAVADLFHL